MNPVELPDYSAVYGIAIGALSLAIIYVSLLGKTKDRDSKYLKAINDFLYNLVKNAPEMKDKHDLMMEDRLKAKLNKSRHKVKTTQEHGLWAARPHLKEQHHLCGFIDPDTWECRCGERKCETFWNLVGSLKFSVPGAQPTPDRKAAIAHTKGKS